MEAEFEQRGIASESRDVLEALASSGLFAEFIQNSEDAVICVDAHHRIATWNSGAQQIYGYTAAEIIGQSAEIFAVAGKEAEFLRGLARTLNGEIREAAEAQRMRKDGSTVYVRSRYFPLRAADGSVLGVLVYSHDISPRKAAESALAESERTLKALLNALPESAVLCTVDGTVLALNETAARNINRPEASIIGSNLFDVPRLEHANLRRANADKVMRTRQPLESTTRFGDTWRYTRIFPVLDDTGDVIRFAIYSMDITEKSRIEAEQKLLQQRLAILLKQLPQIVFYESGGGREYVSGNLLHLLGYDPAGFTPVMATLLQLIHHEDQPRVRLAIADWQKQGAVGPLQIELRCRNAAGDYVWLENLMVEVSPDTGSKYLSGILTDIMRRKQAEAALERSQADLARAQEIAHIGHWEYDMQRDRLECSAEMLRLYRRQPEELGSAAAFYASLHPEDEERVRAVLAHAKQVERQHDIEFRIVRPSGEVRYVRGIGRRVWDAAGPTNIIIGTAQDITEMRQADMTLRQSELQAAQLAAMHATAATYAHEINNPLAGMIGLLQMVSDETRNSDHQQMLNDALAAAMRIRDVTQKLQVIAKPEFRSFPGGSSIIDLRE